MPELATCKNKHTGKIAKYLRCESVHSRPYPITVHVLLIDGKEERWDSESMINNWDLVC